MRSHFAFPGIVCSSILFSNLLKFNENDLESFTQFSSSVFWQVSTDSWQNYFVLHCKEQSMPSSETKKKQVLYQKYKRKLKRINIVVCFFPREIWLLQMDQIHNVTHWSLTGVTNYWSFSFFSLFKWNPFNARIKRFNSHEKWTYYLLFCYFFMWTDITMKPFNQLQYFTPWKVGLI